MAAAGFGMAEETPRCWRSCRSFCGGHGNRAAGFQTTLLAVCATCIVAGMLKQLLKWAAGRYWPESWAHNNPSLIGNGAYGFHPFHSGRAYESFPSGHAAVTCAIMAVLWVSYPRWRWLYVLLAALVCVALVGMNYHFVSDVIAGAIVGSITGVCTARLFRLGNPVSPLPQAARGAGSEGGSACSPGVACPHPCLARRERGTPPTPLYTSSCP